MGEPTALPHTETLLIFHQATARLKARSAAVCEALCLLHDCQPEALRGGPLSDQKGVFWVTISTSCLAAASSRLPRLGYSTAVDMLQPIPEADWRRSQPDLVRWRQSPFRIVRLHTSDPDLLRESAPDRRMFVLETRAGDVRQVRGYRGDGKALSRRALPVMDARLLANLVFNSAGGRFLDPYAGAGGIVIEGLAAGWDVYGSDVDPALRFGLHELGAHTLIADAAALPFSGSSIHALASEPPYERGTLDTLITALVEGHRVLCPGGRMALLCARWQAAALRRTGETLHLVSLLDTDINRKGLDCTALAWEKPG